ASFRPKDLEWAQDHALEAIRRFAADGGGLFQTGQNDGVELFTRSIENHDGVEPAPSSVMADVCLRLYDLTGDERFSRFANATLERFGPSLSTRPLAMPFLLAAWDRAIGKTSTLIIAGLDLPGGKELAGVARESLRPGLVFAAFKKDDRAALAEILPIVKDLAEGARARAYLCVDRACGLPIENPEELRERLT
ncbi:MAG: hypothetical protein NDJ72_12530, partial [Elusimicrobia bacterium]|nr:hypothetical protein [Elusimicrobiota bacterium]